MSNEVPELVPRNQCRSYMVETGGVEPFLVTKEEFDRYCKEDNFLDGPYKERFGDGYGDPYNPYRQAFGTLKDDRKVFCELGEGSLDKTLAKRLSARVKEKILELNQTQTK